MIEETEVRMDGIHVVMGFVIPEIEFPDQEKPEKIRDQEEGQNRNGTGSGFLSREFSDRRRRIRFQGSLLKTGSFWMIMTTAPPRRIPMAAPPITSKG